MKQVLLLIFFISTFSYAQDGSPDSSFGNNGIQFQEFDSNHMYLSSALELQNGAILISGTWYIDEHTNFLIQINENGTPASTYGQNGFLELPETFEIYKIEKQLSDNQFLVYGKNSLINTNDERAFYRINNEGIVDLTYGVDGALTPEIQNVNYRKHTVLENGNVYIASYASGVITIKKYNEDGDIDETFSEINTTLPSDFDIDELSDFNTTSDGAFLVGLRENSEDIRHLLCNITPEGILNNNFGEQGVITLPEPNYTKLPYRYTFTVLQNDEVLVNRTNSEWWGDGNNPTETKIYKVKSNGTIDNTFGASGIVEINNFVGSVTEQQNGRLLFFGTASDFEGGLAPKMIRFNSNGDNDPSFNFQTNQGDYGSILLTNHSNEKIYLLFTSIWYNAPPMYFIAARYNNSPLNVIENEVNPFTISPNPSNTGFFTLLNLQAKTSPYQVLDALGKIIKKGTIEAQESQINLSNFPDGLYYFNTHTQTLKLLKI